MAEARDIDSVLAELMDETMPPLAHEAGEIIRRLRSFHQEQELRVGKLVEALEPFAEFAPKYERVCPEDFIITCGSKYAKRQLTMGDCYQARHVLSAFTKAKEEVSDDQ